MCGIDGKWEDLFTLAVLRNFNKKDNGILTANAVTFRIGVNIVLNPYPTAFPYGNGMVLHFYQQQESSTTKTVHKVINRGLKNVCIVASHW